MFVMVDVAIGLAFTYLLLALFCTAINEWIATVFGLRQRTLVRAIDRILRPTSDGPVGEATRQVLEHPEVKSLAVSARRTPAYIPPHVFATAAKDVVRDDQTSHERWQRRFEDTMDRATGWYKREIQIISFVVAAALTIAANADTLAITYRLWRSPMLRAQFVERARQRVGDRETRRVVATYPNPDEPVPPERSPGDHSAEEFEEDSSAAALTDDDRLLLEGVTGWAEDFRQFNAALCARLEAERDDVCGTPGQDARCEELLTRIAAERRCRVDGLHLIATGEWPAAEFWSRQLWFAFWRHLAGWLLTIAAISVGAPFWFDTLSQFVHLRGAGNRPEDTRPAGKES
jgi:hypothetical protein